MKSLNVFSLLLAGSLLSACGEGVIDTDLPPDSEFGMETQDGKDDSFAIRPGSPEAEAVVRYVNREIANQAEGVAFLDDIDTRLHATAAKNIAKFRSGADGAFGTADDRVFADLADVDRVPYVGRTALMQLFELAEAAGLFQRASVDCADFVDHDRWNNYYIDSYADLLEYENSRCTTINGNLHIEISGTDLLPPAARAVRNLRHLRTVNGNVQIYTTHHLTSMHFDGLETVTGSLRAESRVGRTQTLEFKALKSARSIYLSNLGASLFPALEHNDDIALLDTHLEGFTALKTAGDIKIVQREYGTWAVAFGALTDVGNITFEVPRQNSWTQPDVSFTGGFPKLLKASGISMTNGKYPALAFPKMTEVGSLTTTTAVDPYLGMSKLSDVRSLYSHTDEFAAGVNMGPAVLETVGNISIDSALPVKGYNILQTVEGNINVSTHLGVEGFNALTTIGGSVNLNLGRSRSQSNLNGFNKVSYLNSLTIAANNASVIVGPLFERLENTESNVSLVNNSGFVENPSFKKLGSIGGGLRVDTLRSGVDLMPVLEIVDGPVEINQTPAELTGFPKLERIEGGLTLKANVNKMTGMAVLTAIGGNLRVPRSLNGAELDAFLNRLTEFSGTITFN